ncbi:MAG TPA: bifunctional adenosylcobinamide kinase/adenosylcobinamide-phosphate guanylyltransferase [Nocardioidaceae bacterium]|nr:bifunctional adenosylcobinamide kinase/adenosylcobinamide-phosphate guanylyltransferase [Nocardioidaceae bacterium]
MEITLLGTGSADGWPNPSCACASCQTARREGSLRAQTSALVDDVLLLDAGPEAPRQAERFGRPLTRLQTLLVTHAHPDHFDPALLLYRGWVTQSALQVVGPPGVIAACRDWIGPHAPHILTPVCPGDAVDIAGGYAVHALRARHQAPGGAVLYAVTAPDGERMLYATDTAPLRAEDLEEVRDAAFDVVLLEETFGDDTAHGTEHLDLATFAATLREMRAVGAVGPATDVVAVHLSHRNPPTAELARRLRAVGARAVPDGTALGTAADTTEATDPATRTAPHRTLITGGARSGKSLQAERRLHGEPAVVYAATAVDQTDDPDWRRRVARHQERRPAHWETIETLDLVALLEATGPPLLIDCLTLWLAGVLDRLGAWAEDADADAVEEAVTRHIDALTQAWRSTSRRVVAVTNEVGSGVVPGTAAGGRFRDLLGRLNAAVAAESEQTLLCVAGKVLPL